MYINRKLEPSIQLGLRSMHFYLWCGFLMWCLVHCTKSLPHLALIFYLKGRVAEKETEKEIFHLLIHFRCISRQLCLKWCNTHCNTVLSQDFLKVNFSCYVEVCEEGRKKRGWERGREGDLLAHNLYTHHSQNLVTLMPGSQDSIWVSHTHEGSRYLSHYLSLLVCTLGGT